MELNSLNEHQRNIPENFDEIGLVVYEEMLFKDRVYRLKPDEL
jgi:hypothetical protein